LSETFSSLRFVSLRSLNEQEHPGARSLIEQRSDETKRVISTATSVVPLKPRFVSLRSLNDRGVTFHLCDARHESDMFAV